MSTIHLHQTNHLDARSVHRRAHRFRGQAARSSLATALTSTSKCIAGARQKPTSRKAPAASGNVRTTTGPIPNTSSSQPPIPTLGEARKGHTYTFKRRSDGLTDIDVVVVREGKNLKGWLLGLVVGTVGKGVLEKAFVNSVKAIEARNSESREKGRSLSCTSTR